MVCRFEDNSRQIRKWSYEAICVRFEPLVTPADAEIAGNSEEQAVD
jgi:hypothetical protein